MYNGSRPQPEIGQQGMLGYSMHGHEVRQMLFALRKHALARPPCNTDRHIGAHR